MKLLRAEKALLFASVAVLPVVAYAAPSAISFAQSAPSTDAYDFIEVTVNVSAPDAANPFSDALVTGSFETSDRRNLCRVSTEWRQGHRELGSRNLYGTLVLSSERRESRASGCPRMFVDLAGSSRPQRLDITASEKELSEI